MTDRDTPDRVATAGGGDQSWIEDPGTVSIEAGPRSPTWLLFVAAGGLVVSVACVAGGVALQIVGYLTASLLLFTAVASFRRLSIERAARLGIGTSRSANACALALLLAGFALSVVHAWNVAIHFS